MSNNMEAIKRSADFFDMDVDEHADETINAMSGYDSLLSEEIVDGANGAMELPDAFNFLQFRKSAAWQTIVDAWTTLAKDLEAKSEDSKLSPSERLSSLDQRKGLMQGLAMVASLLQEATERVGRIDANEQLALGTDGMKVAKEAKTLPTEVVTTKKSDKPVTTDELAANTQSAIAFLTKGAN